jgi:membrane protein
VKGAVPGALFSTFVWIIVSAVFSFYVTNFGRYATLYGSLGAIIVLMLWLYLTGAIFILGGELNAVLLRRRQYLEEKRLLDDGEAEDSAEPAE